MPPSPTDRLLVEFTRLPVTKNLLAQVKLGAHWKAGGLWGASAGLLLAVLQSERQRALQRHRTDEAPLLAGIEAMLQPVATPKSLDRAQLEVHAGQRIERAQVLGRAQAAHRRRARRCQLRRRGRQPDRDEHPLDRHRVVDRGQQPPPAGAVLLGGPRSRRRGCRCCRTAGWPTR